MVGQLDSDTDAGGPRRRTASNCARCMATGSDIRGLSTVSEGGLECPGPTPIYRLNPDLDRFVQVSLHILRCWRDLSGHPGDHGWDMDFNDRRVRTGVQVPNCPEDIEECAERYASLIGNPRTVCGRSGRA